MLAYTYVEKGRFELLDKPKPSLADERDAIVRVTLASVCTSDLHIKHGSVPRAVTIPISMRHWWQERSRQRVWMYWRRSPWSCPIR